MRHEPWPLSSEMSQSTPLKYKATTQIFCRQRNFRNFIPLRFVSILNIPLIYNFVPLFTIVESNFKIVKLFNNIQSSSNKISSNAAGRVIYAGNARQKRNNGIEVILWNSFLSTEGGTLDIAAPDLHRGIFIQ